MREPQLIIFVKAPRPGFVKTRLASAIGPEAAAAAYRVLAGAVFDRFSTLPGVQLRFAPDDALNEIQPWLQPNWKAQPQGHGDLGQRMHRAFVEANGPAIVIGSDCPAVCESDIRDAATALRTHDVVLGPATDGGYWLIALNTPCPALFEGIEWSTNHVLKATHAKAAQAGLCVYQLRELHDVDTEKDWSGWRKLNPQAPNLLFSREKS